MKRKMCFFLLMTLTAGCMFSLAACNNGPTADSDNSENEMPEEDVPLVASEGLTYSLNEDGASYAVAGIGTCTDTEIVIPSEYEGLPVTKIADDAFYFLAQSQCTNIESVVMPDSIVSIGKGAFYGCSKLSRLTIGDGVMSIGDFAFGYWQGGFDFCPVEQVSMPANAISFIPKQFLKTVTLTSGQTIEERAFYNCKKLERISIADSITSVGEAAFYHCSGLIDIDWGKGVTSIEGGAFLGCSGLKSIFIPNSVNEIGDTAFAGCTGLEGIEVESGNTAYHSAGNCLIDTNQKILLVGCEASVIPDDGSVASIEGYAFTDCVNLTSITIPESVTSIGEVAFAGCVGLQTITISSQVTTIEAQAFAGCTGFTSISIPVSVTSIGEGAFAGCTGIQSVTIPENVASLGRYAFADCTNLREILVSDNNRGYASYDGILYNKDMTQFVQVPDGIQGEITIPEGMTAIEEGAFAGRVGMTGINIPSSVTSIESMAFSNCSGLEKISVAPGNPVYHSSGNCLVETSTKVLILGCKNSEITSDGSITAIAESAFMDCDGLTEIVVPGSVTSIGSLAFWGCAHLQRVVIGDGVTFIGSYAFANCFELETISFENATGWEMNGEPIDVGIFLSSAYTNYFNYADWSLSRNETDEKPL